MPCPRTLIDGLAVPHSEAPIAENSTTAPTRSRRTLRRPSPPKELNPSRRARRQAKASLRRAVPPPRLARRRLPVAGLPSSPPLGSATEAQTHADVTTSDIAARLSRTQHSFLVCVGAPRNDDAPASVKLRLPTLPARQHSPSLSPRLRHRLAHEVDACNLRNRHHRGWTSATGPSALSFVPSRRFGRRTRVISERQQEPRARLVDRFPRVSVVSDATGRRGGHASRVSTTKSRRRRLHVGRGRLECGGGALLQQKRRHPLLYF